MLNRRSFLWTTAATLCAAGEPKRIAAIVTEYRPNSHADVVVGKYLEGYRQDGRPPKPQVETPVGANVRHAVAISYSGIEIYGFHLLESLQCMVERRSRGETGVAGVRCLEHDAVWKYLDQTPWAQKLFDQGIARSET